MPTPRAGIDYLPDNFDEPPPEPWPLWAQVVVFASVYVCLQWLWSLARQTIIERIAIADITVRPAVWAIHQLTPSVDAVALREWVVRLSSLGSILMALTFIDVPVLFWSSIWEFYLQMFAPSQFSLLVAWGQLLQGGGQLLLGIVAALGSVGIACALSPNVE